MKDYDYENMTEEDWWDYIDIKYQVLAEDWEEAFGPGSWEVCLEYLGHKMKERGEDAETVDKVIGRMKKRSNNA